MRDIYDEKEIKASDPVPQTEVEDDLTQDVTLESELWTFHEVEWHETTQDATTIKYVPVQVRPAVARLRERVAKAATGENWDHSRCVLGNSSSPWTECSSTPQDAKRTNNTSLTKAIRTRMAQIEAGNALENPETIPTNPRSPEDPRNQELTPWMPRTNTTTGRFKLIKSAVEDGDGRRAGKLVKGISGMAPAADVKRNWSKRYPEPKTQTGNSETPFIHRRRQAELPLPAPARRQFLSLQQSHGTWWWKVRAMDVDD